MPHHDQLVDSRNWQSSTLPGQHGMIGFATTFSDNEPNVPHLVQNVIKGEEDPLHILGTGSQARHHTQVGDWANGIVSPLEHLAITNDGFSVSTAQSTNRWPFQNAIWDNKALCGPQTVVIDSTLMKSAKVEFHG